MSGELKAAGMSFILVAKPSSHNILFEWFTELKQLDGASGLQFTDLIFKNSAAKWIFPFQK